MATKSTMKMAKKSAMKAATGPGGRPLPGGMPEDDSRAPMKQLSKEEKRMIGVQLPNPKDKKLDKVKKEFEKEGPAEGPAKKKPKADMSKLKGDGKRENYKGAMTMKKSAAMKQTEKQKSNLPPKLVKAIAKKAGKSTGKEETPKGAMTMKKSALKQTKKMDRLTRKYEKVKSKTSKAAEEGKYEKANRLVKKGKKVARKYDKAAEKAVKKGKVKRNEELVYDYDPATKKGALQK
jgi:hypothetical protein